MRQAAPQTALNPTAHVLGVEIDAVDMEAALARTATALHASRKGYVCMVSVHGIMEARRSPRLAEIYTRSEMNLPDGMPLVWVGNMQGRASIGHVSGPDLMIEIFRRKQFAGFTHFLYGGQEGVAEQLRDKLTQQFPWARIVGTYTPGFHDLTPAEEDRLLSEIKAAKPDIVWIGLGCPKQELFMSRYLPMLDTTLMFGVGAAFDYHTGRIRDCAGWIKLCGLQWLHRLLQDPRRLWRRYLRNNPAFLWHIALQLAGLQRDPGTQRTAAFMERHDTEVRPG
jgi:N-acetylglucosaminyldiphosphoundecaprenol N-acetyl-beta-D-mannosaminyltransferase